MASVFPKSAGLSIFTTGTISFLCGCIRLSNIGNSSSYSRFGCPSCRLGHLFAYNNFISLDIKSLLLFIDWANGTDYGKDITTAEEIKSILPLILQYLTPKVKIFPFFHQVSFLNFNGFFDSGCRLSVSELFRRPLCHQLIRPFYPLAPCSFTIFTKQYFSQK